ncbi:MAG: ATP-dependent Clp protease ATP-binding subunit [Deltaproteobacteria bacterium]|nr:ATP-dependent Clp protease ATP-binding subunit [Deltaproteobacteria bacterium]
MHESSDTVRAFMEAEDIARRAAQPPSSVHLLLALFTFPNRAQVLLEERGLDEDLILREIRVLEDEPRGSLSQLRERAKEIARGTSSKDVDCLHILIALTRMRDSFAYHLLERTNTSLTALRNLAVSFVTGNMPRRYRFVGGRSEKSPTLSKTRTALPSVIEREDIEPISYKPNPNDNQSLKPATSKTSSNPPSAQATKTSQKAKTNVVAQTTSVAEKPIASRIAEIAPNLAACGIDLTERAHEGLLDMAIGRDREIEAVIDILGKRRANNPVLVGLPGVGKTAIVEGLAVKIARNDSDIGNLNNRIIFALDTGALVAGTSLRGAFSERLGAIKTEVAQANGEIVVFVDELHTLIGAGSSGEGAQDAANELKNALARGEFPCIGATTFDEYKKYIEKDAALERRFTPLQIDEPSIDEAILILEGALTPYADHHNVAYSLDAIHAAVQLSHRFINERKLPDKAFAVIDLAGSRAKRRGANNVERLDVARVVHEWSGVPLDRLAEADADRFAQAEQIIGEKLIGHKDVVAAVCRSLRRGFAGFNGKRPMGSFLFLGPTGVGKTELVKILAEFLFGQRDALVRVDMSELSEPHSVARLVGAQPGYVGYEEGGQLTEALRRRPFQIVLFDEIEKAHRDVLALLLQILDEGHLTDSRGRRISFTSTLVILTSNLGSDQISSTGKTIGFGGSTSNAKENNSILNAAKHNLPPELWGRLDERLVFNPLSKQEVQNIAMLILAESSRSLFSEREITLEWNVDTADFLMSHGGYTPETGARGMRQAIQRLVETPIAEKILSGELNNGDVVRLSLNNNALNIAPISKITTPPNEATLA